MIRQNITKKQTLCVSSIDTNYAAMSNLHAGDIFNVECKLFSKYKLKKK